jgi:hypothetical protein
MCPPGCGAVQAWAQKSGHEYQFVDDAIFDLCGAEYRARRRQQALDYQLGAARARP